MSAAAEPPAWLLDRKRREAQVVTIRQKAELLAKEEKAQKELKEQQLQLRKQQEQQARRRQKVANGNGRPNVCLLERQAISAVTAAFDAALFRLKWVQGRINAAAAEKAKLEALALKEASEEPSHAPSPAGTPSHGRSRGNSKSGVRRSLSNPDEDDGSHPGDDIWSASAAGASGGALRRLLDRQLAEARVVARNFSGSSSSEGTSGGEALLERSSGSGGSFFGEANAGGNVQDLHRSVLRVLRSPAAFERLVVAAKGVVVESQHPLPLNATQTAAVVVPGAAAVCVVFDPRCDTRDSGGLAALEFAGKASPQLPDLHKYIARGAYASNADLLPGVGSAAPLWISSGSLQVKFEHAATEKVHPYALAKDAIAPIHTTPAAGTQQRNGAADSADACEYAEKQAANSSTGSAKSKKRLQPVSLACRDWGWRLVVFASPSAEEGEREWMRALETTAASAVLDAPDALGRAPLHMAAAVGNKDAVKVLLDAGANPHVRFLRSEMRTPLHEAARCGHHQVVELLLAANASTTAKDAAGQVPLHLACRGAHPRVVRALLAADAAAAATAAAAAAAAASVAARSSTSPRQASSPPSPRRRGRASSGAIAVKDNRRRRPEEVCRPNHNYVKALLHGGGLENGGAAAHQRRGRAAQKKSPIWVPVGNGNSSKSRSKSPPRRKAAAAAAAALAARQRA